MALIKKTDAFRLGRFQRVHDCTYSKGQRPVKNTVGVYNKEQWPVYNTIGVLVGVLVNVHDLFETP